MNFRFIEGRNFFYCLNLKYSKTCRENDSAPYFSVNFCEPLRYNVLAEKL